MTIAGVSSRGIATPKTCEKILYRSLVFLVVWHYEKLKPYIKQRRVVRNPSTWPRAVNV
jgi:hypothetical protein